MFITFIYVNDFRDANRAVISLLARVVILSDNQIILFPNINRESTMCDDFGGGYAYNEDMIDEERDIEFADLINSEAVSISFKFAGNIDSVRKYKDTRYMYKWALACKCILEKRDQYDMPIMRACAMPMNKQDISNENDPRQWPWRTLYVSKLLDEYIDHCIVDEYTEDLIQSKQLRDRMISHGDDYGYDTDTMMLLMTKYVGRARDVDISHHRHASELLSRYHSNGLWHGGIDHADVTLERLVSFNRVLFMPSHKNLREVILGDIINSQQDGLLAYIKKLPKSNSIAESEILLLESRLKENK